MIHIVTIHHETDKFLDLQDFYFEKFTNWEYKIYSGLSEIDYNAYVHKNREGQYKNYEFVDLNNVLNQHWFRMNYIFNHIKEKQKTFSDEDILIFTDGDAWTITDWVPTLLNLLEKNPVVAVDRRENPEPALHPNFKPYPHPCFFATKARFWDENKLEWSLHPPQIETAGPVLMLWLKQNGYDYTPLLRNNVFNLHPLYFGIYGDMIYHHGAGNRIVYDSIDIWTRKGLNPGFDLDLRYPSIPKFNKKLSDLVYNEIIEDENFINVFLMGREVK